MPSLELLGLLSLISVLLTILVRSADLIEDAFVFLAHKIKVKEFAIGFFILSGVSSLPEFSIALTANDSAPELSLGNLFGAMVILLTLVVGIVVLKFGEIKFTKNFSRNHVVLGLVTMSFSGLALLDGYLSIIDGVFMIAAYLAYAGYVSQRFKFFSALLSPNSQLKHNKKMINIETLLEMLIKSVIGIVLILISSNLLVDVALELSSPQFLNVNPALIGIFIFAVGTNIPELTFLLRAKKKSELMLSLGTIAGSAVLNTFILGVLIVLSEGITITEPTFITLTPVLVSFAAIIVVFLMVSWSGHKITKREAYLLLSIYASLIIGQAIFLGVN